MKVTKKIDIVGSSLRGHKSWIVKGESELFSALPWLTVCRQLIELPDGRKIDDYYQINSSSYVEIVPVDAFGNILVMSRYKHGVRNSTLGFPGGYIELDELPYSAACRELREECALNSTELLELGSWTIDGNRSVAKAHIFIAWNCEPVERCDSDDLEASDLIWIDAKDFSEQIELGRFLTLGAFAAAVRALPIIKNRFK